jgi:ABC-type multidrug transport system permease subunit
MFKRIVNLASKELVQLTRDWLMLTLIIVGPTLELVLLARAVSHGISHMPAMIVDQDHSEFSRQLVAAIDHTDELDVTAYADSIDQMNTWLARDQAELAVIIPRGLEADLPNGTAQVELVADGTNSVAGSTALSAASGAINAFMVRRATASISDLPAIEPHIQVRYNPTLNVRQFTLTSQLGFIVYQVVLIVAALGLTRERELGTLEQLLVTPLRRIELIVGKAVPALIVASVDFVLMWAIIVRGFGLPMQGSFPLLMGLSLLFIFAEIGWGLTISALSRTQQQAVLTVFVLALVDVSFSGYIVPVERLPTVLRAVAQIFPLQHYLILIRDVMLKGADLSAVLDQAMALVALGIGSGAVAFFSLRSRLD